MRWGLGISRITVVLKFRYHIFENVFETTITQSCGLLQKRKRKKKERTTVVTFWYDIVN